MYGNLGRKLIRGRRRMYGNLVRKLIRDRRRMYLASTVFKMV